jgi:hypothetical protein
MKECKNEPAYALAAGVISAAVVSCILLLLRFVPSCGEGNIASVWSMILFLFWTAAAGVFTFDEPYRYTGNGELNGELTEN